MDQNEASNPKLYRVRFSRGECPEDNTEVMVLASDPDEAVRRAQVEGWPPGTAQEVSLAEQRVEALKELGAVLLVIGLGTTFLLVLLVGPHVIAHFFHRWLGAAAALLALVIWRVLGAKPQPGLLEGFICIMGYLMLIMNLVMILALGR